MIKTYIYSSCSSCRKTEAWLEDAGADFVSRDFFRDRLSRHELSSLLNDAGLSVTDVLSTRSKVYKDRRAEIDRLSDDALFDLMIEEPTLLRRPIVIDASSVVIGHNPKQMESLISV